MFRATILDWRVRHALCNGGKSIPNAKSTAPRHRARDAPLKVFFVQFLFSSCRDVNVGFRESMPIASSDPPQLAGAPTAHARTSLCHSSACNRGLTLGGGVGGKRHGSPKLFDPEK